MKHGKILQMWLKAFKIALAESNVEKIAELIKDLPSFEKVTDMTEALYLIKEADKLMQSLQNENQQIKAKLTKHIEFVKSTKKNTPPTLDTSH